MADIYKEQLIKRTNTTKDHLLRLGFWALALFIGFIGFLLGQIFKVGIMVAPLILVGAFLLDKRFNKEYEYIVTNGDLDIDVILNQIKRKRVISIHIKEFLLVASALDHNFEKEFQSAHKVLDLGEGNTSSTTYFALYEKDGQRVKLIFNPNDTILNVIKTYAPRQTHVFQNNEK